LILAVFYKSADGKIMQVEVSGHSGADEAGKDLICAAASAILYTALGALEDICSLSDFYRITEDADGESIPFSEIWIPECFHSKEDENAAQIILRTMQIGYRQLEETVKSDFDSCFIKVKELQYNQEV